MINDMVKKLRAAADALDELMDFYPSSNDRYKIAKQIGDRIKKKGVRKGFKYNGTHWTQLRKNKKRLVKQLKKNRAVQIKKDKRKKNGSWMNDPKNKAKKAKVLQAMLNARHKKEVTVKV